MELNKDNIDNSKNNVDRISRFPYDKNLQDPNYLYPFGHRATPQMKWFKGSREKSLRSSNAA